MEHRDRLEDRLRPSFVGDVVIGHVGEVLAVDAEVRIEVGDDHVPGIKPHRLQLAAENWPAVGHRRRLPDDDSRQQGIFDVKERPHP